MTVLRAFLLRDFRVAWSYRIAFLTQLAGIMTTLITLKFVSDAVGEGTVGSPAIYGGDYFGFALIGSSLSLLSYPTVKAFAGAARGAQVTGTFEAMLATPSSPGLIVIGGGAYSVLLTAAQLVIAIVVGLAVFGADVHLGGLLLALVVVAMTAATLAGVGLMSAAFTIAFKQSEPLSGALVAGSFLLSGTIYPTSVLPGWLSFFSPAIPLTHSIELARQLLLGHPALGDLAPHFAALAGFCLCLPLGLVVLRSAIGFARRNGSLSQY